MTDIYIKHIGKLKSRWTKLFLTGKPFTAFNQCAGRMIKYSKLYNEATAPN
jgi:hypothetical protein